MLVAAEDFYCTGETFAVQILTNQLVDIRRVAVRDQETREHPQCPQNLLLAVENAEMHAEAGGMRDPVVARGRKSCTAMIGSRPTCNG